MPASKPKQPYEDESPPMPPPEPSQFVIRSEWRAAREADQETARQNWSEIKGALRDLQRDLKESKEKPVDYRPVSILVTVGIFVLGAFGTLISYGLSSTDSALRGSIMETREGVTKIKDHQLNTLRTRYTDSDGDADRMNAAADRRRLEDKLAAEDRRLEDTFSADVERLERLLDSRIADLDATLQREIAREIRNLLDAPKERLDHIEEQLTYFRELLDERGTWIAENDTTRAAAAASLKATLDAIKEDLRTLHSEARARASS